MLYSRMVPEALRTRAVRGNVDVASYRARLHLEFVFRDEFAGLEDCQARTVDALDVNASFCAVTKAESLDTQVLSMASHKLSAFNRLCLD